MQNAQPLWRALLFFHTPGRRGKIVNPAPQRIRYRIGLLRDTFPVIVIIHGFAAADDMMQFININRTEAKRLPGLFLEKRPQGRKAAVEISHGSQGILRDAGFGKDKDIVSFLQDLNAFPDRMNHFARFIPAHRYTPESPQDAAHNAAEQATQFPGRASP